MKLSATSFLLTLAALTPLALTPLARAGEIPPEAPAAKPAISTSWKISLAPLVASQALDITSSYGMSELNPLLAGPQGQFGAQSAVLKLGVTAGLIGVEYSNDRALT